MTTFDSIRKDALTSWTSSYYHDLECFIDSDYTTYHCYWQNLAIKKGYNHISLFCSLGSFTEHLTDILNDQSCDYIHKNSPHADLEKLFRFYSRLMLIYSELLTDFQDIYIIASKKIVPPVGATVLKAHKKKARAFLSRNSISIQSDFEFINTVFKHKTNNIHHCNNHLPFIFEDLQKMDDTHNYISVNKKIQAFQESTMEGIQIPKLKHLVSNVINGYAKLHTYFKDNQAAFEHICDHYNNPTYIG